LFLALSFDFFRMPIPCFELKQFLAFLFTTLQATIKVVHIYISVLNKTSQELKNKVRLKHFIPVCRLPIRNLGSLRNILFTVLFDVLDIYM
jgi:hypothetical protein